MSPWATNIDTLFPNTQEQGKTNHITQEDLNCTPMKDIITSETYNTTLSSDAGEPLHF